MVSLYSTLQVPRMKTPSPRRVRLSTDAALTRKCAESKLTSHSHEIIKMMQAASHDDKSHFSNIQV